MTEHHDLDDPVAKMLQTAQDLEAGKAEPNGEQADPQAGEPQREIPDVQREFNKLIDEFLKRMEAAGNPGTTTYYFYSDKELIGDQWEGEHTSRVAGLNAASPFGYALDGWPIAQYPAALAHPASPNGRIVESLPSPDKESKKGRTSNIGISSPPLNAELVLLTNGVIGSVAPGAESNDIRGLIDHRKANISDYSQVFNLEEEEGPREIYLTEEMVEQAAEKMGKHLGANKVPV